jgi:hypothetical protein
MHVLVSAGVAATSRDWDFAVSTGNLTFSSKLGKTSMSPTYDPKNSCLVVHPEHINSSNASSFGTLISKTVTLPIHVSWNQSSHKKHWNMDAVSVSGLYIFLQ